MFFAMQKTDFHEFELFCRKSHFSLIAQNHFFRASKNTNSVFSATKQMMNASHMLKSFFLSEKKLLNAILRAKLKYMKNHFFRASKNTNSVFSATKQMRGMQMPQMLKSFFLSEKKLLNAILRAKLKYMKNGSFS